MMSCWQRKNLFFPFVLFDFEQEVAEWENGGQEVNLNGLGWASLELGWGIFF